MGYVEVSLSQVTQSSFHIQVALKTKPRVSLPECIANHIKHTAIITVVRIERPRGWFGAGRHTYDRGHGLMSSSLRTSCRDVDVHVDSK